MSKDSESGSSHPGRALSSRAGLAPAIACCEPSQGILVTEWTGGHAWTAEELRLPGNIRALTGLLRQVHALQIPRPARILDPAAVAMAGAILRAAICPDPQIGAPAQATT